jgi:nucleotide-binding universal stress UspA family protein
MTARDDTGPIVVGIDGSTASIDAALWAINEAVHRGVPLRLVSATNVLAARVAEPTRSPELTYAHTALRTASAAITATGKPVAVQTSVCWGPPANALIAESHSATTVCVASVGMGVIARAILGSTAAAVADRAHCPVAVIRPSTGTDAGNWVAAGIDGWNTGDRTVEFALAEARLRRATLVIVGLGCNGFGVNDAGRTYSRSRIWAERNPDIELETAVTSGGLADFLADEHAELSRRHPPAELASNIPLAVIGSEDVTELPRLIGPHDGGLLTHARCAAMVVR